ncbi:MAG: acetyl-CoA carboxylase carboxyltransferase subunit alpha [Candidatus Ozemobacteraceae bacterium]
MSQEFEFERPISELEKRLSDLRSLSEEGHIDLSREISAISEKIDAMKVEIFHSLEPWQVTQVARHLDRPSTLDYIKILCDDSFVEFKGDRLFGDDPAMVCGFGRFGKTSAVIIGHQKGHDTEENIHRNFGMPHPEGYRKSRRLMHLAEKFHKPIIIFIDTPGAFPGLGAEERGQSEAIARSIMEMSRMRVPILCFIIGEGGSGGALAVGIGDRVYMLEHAIYSVITAEGCAAILWKDAAKAREAASALKIRSSELLEAGIIDGVIPEPLGGAHHNSEFAARVIGEIIQKELPPLLALPVDILLKKRYDKFRAMGKFKLEQDSEHA